MLRNCVVVCSRGSCLIIVRYWDIFLQQSCKYLENLEFYYFEFKFCYTNNNMGKLLPGLKHYIIICIKAKKPEAFDILKTLAILQMDSGNGCLKVHHFWVFYMKLWGWKRNISIHTKLYPQAEGVLRVFVQLHPWP